jgi:glycosyltransferase involved in cell wall biosynthesis
VPLSWPRISVVTPSFNQGQFLGQAIESVLGQNYPNLEYLVMDGGSTDASVQVIKKHESRIDYWVSRRDAGQADAIHRGFSMATGEILCWVNSDDYLCPGALFKVGELFRREAAVDFAVGGYAAVRRDRRLICKHYALKQDFLSLLCAGQLIGQMACFWRREAYAAAGGIDPTLQFCFDYDLFLRLVRGKEPALIDDILACCRFHDATKSATIWQSVGLEEQRVVRSRHGYEHLASDLRAGIREETLRRKAASQHRGLCRDILRDPRYALKFLAVRTIDGLAPGLRKPAGAGEP